MYLKLQNWYNNHPTARIWRQLYREFNWPLLGAALWGFLVYYNVADPTSDLAKGFTGFFTGLFFFSFFWGQFNRVKKQIEVKDDLRSMISQLDQHTKDITGYATGGNNLPSFEIDAHIVPAQDGQKEVVRARFKFANLGRYPIFSCNGFWINNGLPNPILLGDLQVAMKAEFDVPDIPIFQGTFSGLQMNITTRSTVCFYDIILVNSDNVIHWAIKKMHRGTTEYETSFKFPTEIDYRALLPQGNFKLGFNSEKRT